MKKIKIKDFADFILWEIYHPYMIINEKYKNCLMTTKQLVQISQDTRIEVDTIGGGRAPSLDTTTFYACQGGDKLPVPDGVKMEFIIQSFKIDETGYRYLDEFYHVGNASDYMMDIGDSNAITGFRILGLEEGYELDMSDDK